MHESKARLIPLDMLLAPPYELSIRVQPQIPHIPELHEQAGRQATQTAPYVDKTTGSRISKPCRQPRRLNDSRLQEEGVGSKGFSAHPASESPRGQAVSSIGNELSVVIHSPDLSSQNGQKLQSS